MSKRARRRHPRSWRDTRRQSAGGSHYTTRLDIPDGARIREISWVILDNDATNFALFLTSYDVGAQTFEDHIGRSSSGASSALQTITHTFPIPLTVTNSNRSYHILMRPGIASANHLIVGARVGYAFDQVAPVAFKLQGGGW